MTILRPRPAGSRAPLLLPSLLCILLPACSRAQKPKDMVYEPVVPPASDLYTPGPDSKPQPNVPKGQRFNFTLNDSKVFPQTTRAISVYVPAEYDPKKPACLYVGLDGLNFEATTVFDNLIAQHAMPVTIAIGIGPGEVPSASAPEDPRYDRSFEFDTRSARLARFILEEVIPAIESRKMPDGQSISISRDPNDHAIGGGSTGGIGSFTVAWERPDAFRRVFMSIGTFVGMRGGERYYVQVRKTEPKPIRIFMQDGANDEWPGGPEMGDWFMSNVTMNRALEFAGYDVKHVWGSGTHGGAQATALFPDAMRWLWRDYPTPIQAKAPGNPRLKDIEPDGETWQLAGNACGGAFTLATNPKGDVFFDRAGAREPEMLPTNATADSCGAVTEETGPALAFGHDGELYKALPTGGIGVSTPGSAGGNVVGKPLVVRSFTVRNNGDIYATTQTDALWGELWLIRANGQTVKLDDKIKGPTGVAFSPDGLWLFVAQSTSHQGLSFRVLKDGKVDSCEPLFEFYVPDTADDSGAAGVAMDRNGWAYAATRMGIQVFDRNGRVTVILPLPGNEAATGVSFGGPDFSTLYVAAAGGKIYKRRLKVAGFPPFAPAVKLPKWGAG
jgi:gluconolactonase